MDDTCITEELAEFAELPFPKLNQEFGKTVTGLKYIYIYIQIYKDKQFGG